MTIVIVVAVIAVLVLVYVNLYNGIIRARNRCDNALQDIDAQLQRRSDLIPNLVSTVKGYAAHESGTLEAVTAARTAVESASTTAAKLAANDQLTGALSHLFAVAENYPQLKADTNFLELQRELSDTENKISYARQSFNDVVMKYNDAIQTFPGNLVAGISHFEAKEGFKVESPEARETPKVEF